MLEDKKVTIKVDKLLASHHSVKFKNFLESNRETVFTAKRLYRYEYFYILKEDTSAPKWIFYEEDLQEVE